ncbi:MAG: hypothetical protein HGB08_01535 [Candidatus Moranbacteria bacterium]|nr:hypothetical protein [Candidatus Moranbacteria bacterium]
MKIYICEICGDAYIGSEKPANCPFCGARSNFIKDGAEAKPIVNEKIEISEESRKNLLETLDLEIDANAIYLCMAGKAKEYMIKAMYKRLAKVEFEHATIVTKLLGMDAPKAKELPCPDSDAENFEKTIALEDHAAALYREFVKKSAEKNIRIFFTALSQVEEEHKQLISEIA